jgi:hypothetical protein
MLVGLVPALLLWFARPLEIEAGEKVGTDES